MNQEANNLSLTKTIAGIGRLAIESTCQLFCFAGGVSILFGSSSKQISAEAIQWRKASRTAVIDQMLRVGVRAIPIVCLVMGAIGVILPLQMFGQLDEFGQADQIATINAIAAFRELGPLMTAIVLSGFAGASIAAELATMSTAEEIEALESMALDPIRYLVVPRLIATVIMTVLLSVIADVVMVGSGMFTGIKLGLDADVYMQTTKLALTSMGFITGLIKAFIYGLLIGLIACHLGLSVKSWQGSAGVGQATTNTVVYSIVAIISAAAIFTLVFYAYGWLV